MNVIRVLTALAGAVAFAAAATWVNMWLALLVLVAATAAVSGVEWVAAGREQRGDRRG